MTKAPRKALLVRTAGACAVSGRGDIQASADFRQHVLIDPRPVLVRTSHSRQSAGTRSDGGSGSKPGAATRAIDLRWMAMAHLFHQRPKLDGNLLAQGLVMNCRRVFQPRRELHQRLMVAPCAVMFGTSHSPHAD